MLEITHESQGPRRDSEFESALIARCWENWRVPGEELSSEMLGTFLRQQIANPAKPQAA